MALYRLKNNKASVLKTTQFGKEKDLQGLVENNLQEIFDCKFVATEFSTGEIHGGRIDTLALSEDGNPVIIEYKKVESSDLVNQSLFYLSWINDHKGDFQVAVNNTLGKETDIDWSTIRVICIAPGYKKYDLHAVKMMGANIELWQYKLYEDSFLSLEEVFKKRTVMMEVGKRSNVSHPKTQTKKTLEPATYVLEDHLDNKSESIKELVTELRDFILELDDSVEEVPKKHYIAYKVNKNFVCIEVQKTKIYLFLKIDPKSLNQIPKAARDVSKIGHFGTGDLELTVRSGDDLNPAKELITESFENIGG